MAFPVNFDLPFAHLNLRFNPFGELEPQTRAELAVVSLKELRRRRRRLYRRAETLALTTHDSLQPELESAGYTVCTRTVDSTDASTITELVRRRIEHARRSPGPVPDIDAAGIGRLKSRFGSDIRAIENYLYDIFKNLDRPRHVEV